MPATPSKNQATIEGFYAAFAELDGDTMQACYAEDAVFDDEVFSLRGRRQIGGMWRMLCTATRDKGRVHWKIETRDAHYMFSATGRKVINRIDATFEFNAEGLIVKHRDRFDFWAWARQALGVPGLVLGWAPPFRKQVKQQAAASLQRFLDKA